MISFDFHKGNRWILFSNDQANLWEKVTELVRFGLFLIFYFFCIRVILLSLLHLPLHSWMFLGPFLIAIAFLVYVKSTDLVQSFVAAIPLLSGIQLLCSLKTGPLIDLIFCSIFLGWFPKRVFVTRETIKSKTRIGNFIDLLSGIILASTFLNLIHLPLDVSLYLFWNLVPGDQADPLYGIEAASILLQGLFFYRVLELEWDNFSSHKIKRIFCIQAITIIFFSALQMIFNIPDPYANNHRKFALNSPFNDFNSYGSYIVFLLGFFISLRRDSLWGKMNSTKLLLYSMILFSILSYSRMAWSAMIFIVSINLLNKLSFKKKMIFLVCSFGLIGLVNVFPAIIPKWNDYFIRLRQLLIFRELRETDYGYGRWVMWQRALYIAYDFPITGSGLGSYFRISPSYQDPRIIFHQDLRENAHNYFLQFGAELGIPALLIFLWILIMTYKKGLQEILRNKQPPYLYHGLLLGLTGYLLTCLTGHPLLLSNQQYLFWFIIASVVILIDGNKKIEHFPPGFRLIESIFIPSIIILILVIGYLFSSIRLPSRDHKNEYGLYPYEIINGKKVRWISKRTFFQSEVKGDVVAFEVTSMPLNIGPAGLNFKLIFNGELWDEINFTRHGSIMLCYYLPFEKDDTFKVKTVVNNTFRPMRIGLNQDIRELGLLMSEFKYYDELPKEGIGFYKWESWERSNFLGKNCLSHFNFRWTRMRASMVLEEKYKNGARILIMAQHPDINKKEVKVQIWGNKKKIRQEILSTPEWKEIRLTSDHLKGINVLTFQVDRTWNPQILGFSDDSRDLGVAVAILKENGISQ